MSEAENYVTTQDDWQNYLRREVSFFYLIEVLGTPILKWVAVKNRPPCYIVIHSWVYLGLTDWCLDEIGADKSHDEAVRSHRSPKSISVPINIVTMADGVWTREGGDRRPHSVSVNRQGQYSDFKLKTSFCNPGAEETEAAPAARRATTQWMSPHLGGQKYTFKMV